MTRVTTCAKMQSERVSRDTNGAQDDVCSYSQTHDDVTRAQAKTRLCVLGCTTPHPSILRGRERTGKKVSQSKFGSVVLCNTTRDDTTTRVHTTRLMMKTKQQCVHDLSRCRVWLCGGVAQRTDGCVVFNSSRQKQKRGSLDARLSVLMSVTTPAVTKDHSRLCLRGLV